MNEVEREILKRAITLQTKAMFVSVGIAVIAIGVIASVLLFALSKGIDGILLGGGIAAISTIVGALLIKSPLWNSGSMKVITDFINANKGEKHNGTTQTANAEGDCHGCPKAAGS